MLFVHALSDRGLVILLENEELFVTLSWQDIQGSHGILMIEGSSGSNLYILGFSFCRGDMVVRVRKYLWGNWDSV